MVLGAADTPAAYLQRLREASREVLNAVNVAPYAYYDRLVERILSNVRNRVQYERLSEHGPMLGPITARCPLVATYFTRLPVPEHDRVRARAGVRRLAPS